ncbi:Protein neprosin [Cardamine amara subsp. amara]|uniref:Protein neprosin n=1 Tax=Cardamine amara subsp. amara TaxID=228776 RepID=A0ABD1ABF5_CARAN
MGFLLKLVAFVVSFSLVQSTESIEVLKSIKLNEKMIYDCLDIYKQPSLNHPSLQNHKIQMEPSFSTLKSTNQTESKRNENPIDCPNGTVPILRNTKEYVENAQYFTEKRFNPLTIERHGEHMAGIRSEGQGPYHGVAASMSVHDMIINSGQSSYANIYVTSGVNNTVNLIETGWMINPSIFGDGRTWSYGYWKGAKGGGCYNNICHGFVQVSKTEPLSGPIAEAPPGKRYISVSIQQDQISRNWWVTDVKFNQPDIHIGYWAKEMFDLISNGGDIVGVGGGVQASPSGKSPPMGNGHFPTIHPIDSARVPDMRIMDSSHTFKPQSKFKFELLLDNDKCYGFGTDYRGFLFTYGGPGGDSCGI